MKFLVAYFVAIASAFGADLVATNQYVTVDQDGNISHSNVVASISAVAKTAAEAEVVATKAEAVAASAQTATNTLNAIVADLASRELVIYQQGYTTAFDSTVFLSEDSKVCIYRFDCCIAVSGDGTKMAHDLYYACTEQASAIVPTVKYSDSIKTNTTEWGELTDMEGPFSADGYTDEVSGQEYPYGYRVRVWTAASNSGFFRIILNGGDPLGEGYTFDIKGGITGGLTDTITIDGLKLSVNGGLITAVESVDND